MLTSFFLSFVLYLNIKKKSSHIGNNAAAYNIFKFYFLKLIYFALAVAVGLEYEPL